MSALKKCKERYHWDNNGEVWMYGEIPLCTINFEEDEKVWSLWMCPRSNLANKSYPDFYVYKKDAQAFIESKVRLKKK